MSDPVSDVLRHPEFHAKWNELWEWMQDVVKHQRATEKWQADMLKAQRDTVDALKVLARALDDLARSRV